MKIFTSTVRTGALALGLAACVTALPASADEVTIQAQGQSKQATAGGLTGLVVGAAAGGPVGAIVGLTAGVILGDRYHHQKTAAAALASDLGMSEAERARLAQQVADLDTTLNKAQARDALQEQALQQTNDLRIDVGFRTNDDSISLQTLPPLLKLGALAAALPQAKVRVAGFTDPRGDGDYNQALSLRRAQGVAAVLASAGVAPERIVIEAHGKSDSTSSEGDLDAYAFDRRVSVQLELPGSDQVARRE
jgi:outer membrane protein OmpA-like peptidoglycan-associated protein